MVRIAREGAVQQSEKHAERGSFRAGTLADCREALDLCGGDWQGGRNGWLLLPRLRQLFRVEFRLDFRVRNCNESAHKIHELAKVTCRILRGTLRVIRHSDLLRRRVEEWCATANARDGAYTTC
jgi:hypothetical protein